MKSRYEARDIHQRITGTNSTLTRLGIPIGCLDTSSQPSPVTVSIGGVDTVADSYVGPGDLLFEQAGLNSGGGSIEITVSLPAGTYDFSFFGTYVPYVGPPQYSMVQVVSGIVGVTDYSSYVGSGFGGIPVDGCTPIVFEVEPATEDTEVTPFNGMQIMSD